MTGKVSCDEIKSNLSAFVDGELSKECNAKLCEHLFECECCKKEYELLKLTQKAVKNYFQKSTENVQIPYIPEKEKPLNKVIFLQRRKKLIYSAVACSIAIVITLFSINLLSSKENIHEVKFNPAANYVEGESQIIPLPEKPIN